MTQEELELLLERLHHDCYGWALACCRWNREEALEVLQTAYVRVLEGRARLNGFPAPRAWLFGVIRRTALEQRRRWAVRAMGRGDGSFSFQKHRRFTNRTSYIRWSQAWMLYGMARLVAAERCGAASF